MRVLPILLAFFGTASAFVPSVASKASVHIRGPTATTSELYACE